MFYGPLNIQEAYETLRGIGYVPDTAETLLEDAERYGVAKIDGIVTVTENDEMFVITESWY